MSLFAGRCSRCGTTVGRAMLGALVQDAGGFTSHDPIMCWATDNEQEHDWIFPQPAKEAAPCPQN